MYDCVDGISFFMILNNCGNDDDRDDYDYGDNDDGDDDTYNE